MLKKLRATKKKIVSAISACVAVAALLTGSVFLFAKDTTAKAEEIFGKKNKVEVTADVAASDDQNGKKGILLSASDNGASVQINGLMSGKFQPEFRPYSAVSGVQDFDGLTFHFASEESRLGFSVEFSSTVNGVSIVYSLSNTTVVSKTVTVDGSFCNLDKRELGFTFDPATMTVATDFGAVFADMQDETFMKEFLTATTLPSWKTYSVTVSFSGIRSGATANVLFYSVNGQQLSGKTLSNTSSAQFVTDLEVPKGVVGKAYAVPTAVTTYDVLDGYKQSFEGEISVFAPNGLEVTVTDGVFTPTETGDYTLRYTLKDSEGLTGELREYSARIFETAPEVNISYGLPMEQNELGVGSTAYIPSAFGNSELTAQALPVRVAVKKDGQTLREFAEGGVNYTFDSVGTYQISYLCADSVGTATEDVWEITVTDIPKAKELNIATERTVGEVFAAPVLNFEKDGVEYVATHTVFLPDGSSTQADGVQLETEGLYSVVWAFEYNGKTYQRTAYFHAMKNPQSAFKSTGGLTVTGDYVAPSYADEAYNGVLLTARQALSAEFVNVFDISDNTKDDTLIEFFVSPLEAGTMEFEQLDIYFYDVYDESNFIHIHLEDDPWLYYFYAMTVIGLRTDGFDVTGANFRKYYYGHFVYSSFYGKDSSKGAYPSQSVRISFDYETGKLYAHTAAADADIGVKKFGAKTLIADLKDEAWVGAGNAFEGFTTGETRMVVNVSKLKGEANLMILNVDGQSLAGNRLQDKTAPSVFVDYDGNDAENIPLGEVGKAYKIYDAYVQDVASGYSKNVTSEVYFVSGGVREKVKAYNGTFTPETVGNYEIVYTGCDFSGNTATRTVPVQVVAAGEIPALTYTFNDTESTLQQGETARFLGGVAGGGTGKLYVDVKATFDGDEIEMNEDGCFKVTQSGTYVIEARVRDYNGVSDPFRFEIYVTETVEPLIYESTVNSVVRAGETVVLPAFKAVTYDGATEKQAEVKYYIDDVELPESREWTPAENEEKSYVYKAQSGNSSKSYEIHAVSSDSNGYAASFFYAEGASLNSTRSALEYSFAEGVKLGFARAIDLNFFNVSLSALSDNFSNIIVTLTDSVNPEERVELTVRKGVNAKGEQNRAFCGVNGKEREMRGEFFNSNIPLYIAYDANTRALTDDLGNALGRIERTADDKRFDGFSSGFVYVTFEVAGVLDGQSATMGVIGVAGQKFASSIRSDRNGPMIKIFGQSGEVNVGDTVTVYPAMAFDLLSGAKSITVSVTLGGTDLYKDAPCDEAFTFKASSYGTYSIIYTAKDALGYENSAFESITVADRVPPQMSFDGEMIEGAKAQKTYRLPSVTVTDDYSSVSVYVYAIAPNAEMQRIIDYKFKPTQTGKYKIIYMAVDGAGASSIETFDIWVVK